MSLLHGIYKVAAMFLELFAQGWAASGISITPNAGDGNSERNAAPGYDVEPFGTC
jgi:hypothetical protein